MDALGILTGTLANNFFQAIWLCCIVPEPKHNRKKTALIVAVTTLLYTGIVMAVCMAAFQRLSAPVGVFLGYLVGVLLYGIMYCFLVSASHPVKSLFFFYRILQRTYRYRYYCIYCDEYLCIGQ